MTSAEPERIGSNENVRSSGDAKRCDVSVVVPTFNRRDSLRQLLDSLSQQTLLPDRFEVVVVNDGSTDGTVELLRAARTRSPNVRFLDLPNRGPAAARNAGARTARGCYLAFTDDDCLAELHWLEQLVQTFEKSGAVAVQGRTTTERSACTPLTHQIEILGPWLSSMSTCNAAYLKSAFDSVGGFDEKFPSAHNEDRDLVWRVEELGPVVFAPEALIIHPPRRESFGKIARRVRVFETDFLLYAKSPAKYRKYISASPWRTIYFNVGVVQQLNDLKSNFRYLIKSFRPFHLLVGLGIILARWFYLGWFFPKYWKAHRVYRPDSRPAGNKNLCVAGVSKDAAARH